MDDLISRQAAIDALEEPCKVSDTWTDEYAVGERMQWEKDVKALNSLPSAERNGSWIELYENNYKCSVCGTWWTCEGMPIENGLSYCPTCGAKMDTICPFLSDEEVKQPCIEGPCGFECKKMDEVEE